MLTVGFEPTRANTVDLKSTPLDQLGHVSVNKTKIKQNGSGNNAVFHRYQTHIIRCAATGIEPASGHK